MISGRWRLTAGVATAAMATSMIGLYAVSALAPFLVADLGLTRAAIGGLVTVSFGVAAGLSLFAGHLVDRWGTRRGLLALAGAVAVSLAIASAATSYLWLVAALAFTGLGQAIANPATNVLIAGAVPPERRGVAMGLKGSGVQLAAFAAGLVLPAVAVAAGWQTGVRWAVLLPVVVLAAVWWLVPAPAARAAGREWRWTPPSRWLWWLIGYSLLLGVSLSAVNVYLPLYAVQSLGQSEQAAGALLAAFGVTGLVGRVAWGRWSDRLPDVAVLLAWLSAVAVAGAGLLLASGFGWAAAAWVGAVVIGGSATAANAMSMLLLVRRGGATGHASGLVSAGFFGGFVIGPPAVGALADTVGYPASWLAVAVVFAGSALLALRVRQVGSAVAVPA